MSFDWLFEWAIYFCILLILKNSSEEFSEANYSTNNIIYGNIGGDFGNKKICLAYKVLLEVLNIIFFEDFKWNKAALIQSKITILLSQV